MTSMQEARAAEGKVIDGSELTHDEESIGYDTKITRGEDLLTGYSKCTKLGDGKIYAGGTTVARQVVKSVQIAVLVERAKEEDKEWSYYDNWHKENKNTNRAMSNRTLYVEGGYYYRVRCTHAVPMNFAASPAVISSTSGSSLFIPAIGSKAAAICGFA